MRGVALTLAMLAPLPAEARDLLSCRFGPDCVENADCAAPERWQVVRQDEDGGYLLADQLSNHVRPVALTRLAHMLLFEGVEQSTDATPAPASGALRLAVTDDRRAVLQDVLYIEAEPGKWRLFATSVEGVCEDISR